MPVQPPNADAESHGARERAAEAATLGLGPRLDRHAMRDLLVGVQSDPDARVRAAALGALARRAPKANARSAWRRATTDVEPSVRRRAAELAPLLDTRATRATMVTRVLVLLDDDNTLVAEAAAFALGELGSREDREIRDAATADPSCIALARATTEHPDPLVREAAVAALGAIGATDDAVSLSAVLAATHDRPAIRRRAVLALAAFEGPEVEAAIRHALTDPDWQVRQAGEDLAR
jgi:HEAT repeat protein